MKCGNEPSGEPSFLQIILINSYIFLVGAYFPLTGSWVHFLAGRAQFKKKSKYAYPRVSIRFSFWLLSYDVDFPIECDDEYWTPTDPNQAFTQPLGKPSIISGFVYHIKLCEILAFSLKTLYSTKKSKLLSGLTGNQWERQVVAELDSAMNNWKDSLPPHRAFLLRFKSPVYLNVPRIVQWDPTRQNAAFYYQSLTLHASYYYTQIQIHRPFLLKKSTLSLSSLTICTNAARSCSRLLAVALTRGVIVYPNIIVECPSQCVTDCIHKRVLDGCFCICDCAAYQYMGWEAIRHWLWPDQWNERRTDMCERLERVWEKARFYIIIVLRLC